MAEYKTYYYLKLKEDFFDSEDIKILESMDNGYLYSNILLKMYLKSLKNQGGLIFKEFIPYNAKMLSTITGHNVDVVEKAITIFKELGLIEVLDNGTIFMTDIQKFIGKLSTEGQRKAEYRERINREKQKSLLNGTMSQECHTKISNSCSISNSISLNVNEKEKRLENFQQNSNKILDIEIKDKDIDINVSQSDSENDLKSFMDKWNVSCENINGYLSGKLPMIDFKALDKYMELSTYLRTDIHARYIEFYINNYQKIITGFYSDKKRKNEEQREIDYDFINSIRGDDN